MWQWSKPRVCSPGPSASERDTSDERSKAILSAIRNERQPGRVGCSNVYLNVVPVIVSCGDREVTTHSFWDPGSSLSFCERKLICYGLKKTKKFGQPPCGFLNFLQEKYFPVNILAWNLVGCCKAPKNTCSVTLRRFLRVLTGRKVAWTAKTKILGFWPFSSPTKTNFNFFLSSLQS